VRRIALCPSPRIAVSAIVTQVKAGFGGSNIQNAGCIQNGGVIRQYNTDIRIPGPVNTVYAKEEHT
jgi:hypothetical protein